MKELEAPTAGVGLGAMPFFAASMGILFGHTGIISGINYSAADIGAFVLVAMLMIRRQLIIPAKSALFFLIVSFSGILAAWVYVPAVVPVNVSGGAVLIGFMKVAAVYGYFVLGYSLERLGLTEVSFKWFAFGALFSGFISLALPAIGLASYAEPLYFANVRLQGFMSDPNYFAVYQVAAIAIFVGARNLGMIFRVAAIAVLMVSVVLSGSKTGVLSLLIFGAFKISEEVLSVNAKAGRKSPLVLISLICAATMVIAMNFETIVAYLSSSSVAFERISVLFTDIDSADGASSSRGLAWSVAASLIALSPLIGLGFGTYTLASEALWDVSIIAHNTYLQLAVEWGLPLAIVFFGFVLYVVLKSSLAKGVVSAHRVVLRDIVGVLMIGSLGISLNNARVFWIALGALALVIGEISGVDERVSPGEDEGATVPRSTSESGGRVRQ